jgi:hypothetical protein
MAIQKVDRPSEATRVETGAVQFGDDWPGLFVRGDQAIHLAHCIGYVEPFMKTLIEKGSASASERFDGDHLDMALGALREVRRIINEEVVV